MSVIGRGLAPPRAIDEVVVGDGLGGFAICPTGKLTIALLQRGSDAAESVFFYNGNGSVVSLRIDGRTATDTGKRFSLPGHPVSMQGRTR